MTDLAQQQDTTTMPQPPLQLSAVEARVLGALMEKQYATPETYPLTQNALHNACNQKSSREPVMQMTPGEVGHTLRQLESRNLISTENGSRSERFTQRLGFTLGVNQKRQALLCLLLLRGPQTLSELLTRSARLADFADVEDVRLSLLKLIERPEPLVTKLERQSGQREERYGHLLSGTPIAPTKTESKAPSKTASDATNDMRVIALEEKVRKLEMMVDQMHEQLGMESPLEAKIVAAN